ncbi:MAG: TetR/AcrR family transcriptional regulator [bacterium]
MTGAERKKQIVAVTEAIVAKHGVQGATTARIAQAAGVSEKTLYLHFSSRREMLIAALDDVFNRASNVFRQSSGSNAVERLREAVQRHWPSESEFVYPLFEFFAAPPEAGLRGELRIRHQDNIDALSAMVEEGKSQGVIRPEVDSVQTAWELLSIYWAEDVAYLIGFEEFATTGRSALMLERILRDISSEPQQPGVAGG